MTETKQGDIVVIEGREQMPARMDVTDQADRAGALLIAITRAAQDPRMDVERVERMYELYAKERAREAEIAFNHAMSQAQSEMRTVIHNAENKGVKGPPAGYANLDAIDRMVRECYTNHGFALMFDSDRTEIETLILVKARLAHEAGFSREYSLPIPCDGKGAQGGDVMTKTHATISAVTYGRRALTSMIFNVVTGKKGEDDDGNAAGGKPDTDDREKKLTMKELAELTSAIKKAGMTEETFCKAYEIEVVSDLPPNRYARALQLMKEREQKGKPETRAPQAKGGHTQRILKALDASEVSAADLARAMNVGAIPAIPAEREQEALDWITTHRYA